LGDKIKVPLLVYEKEKNLILQLRNIAHGEVTVIMFEGLPVEIDKIKEKVRL
jgi:hypothetical protein